MGTSTLLSEADLHGLVDGFLDPGRRAEVLRRAAASPRDRALVEDWQDQNDAIRIAFADVEREPLPADLDLRLVGPLDAGPIPVDTDRRASRKLLATVLVAVSAGLIAAWAIAGPDLDRLVAMAVPGGVFRAPEDALARLPTTLIPDLSQAGFAFVTAKPGTDGEGLVFRYSHGATDWVSIGAARAPASPKSGSDRSALATDHGGLAWTERGVSYTISGTIAPEHLRTLALMVRTQPSRD